MLIYFESLAILSGKKTCAKLEKIFIKALFKRNNTN